MNAHGLYTTVFSHAIRQIDAYCESIGQNFVLIVDEHSARKELLETAAKTMYGNAPTRKLLSPPFEVESYLNQNMQAADWIATIVGRLWSYRICTDDYKMLEPYEKYYWQRLHAVTTHSTVMTRPKKSAPTFSGSKGKIGSLGAVLQQAIIQKETLVVAEKTTVVVQDSLPRKV
ncbi:hypothetical protein C241_15178 [Bradyrhizobium lupini HPC(L)]|uniref:Transposase n=1 Tax=Bradyrhizobium lupini HPC(L) TaxID=1229491 RepID=A0ABN0HKV6_RHILU|nr:hypothetical protein C241_15178 [Bradyrhizobium lupini HPC(L)]